MNRLKIQTVSPLNRLFKKTSLATLIITLKEYGNKSMKPKTLIKTTLS